MAGTLARVARDGLRARARVGVVGRAGVRGRGAWDTPVPFATMALMTAAAQPRPPLDGLEAEDAKDALRRAVRAARSARSERLRQEAAVAFADAVERVPGVASARCVALYASRPHEPGTGELLDRLEARGVRVLLPVLGTGLQRNWAQYAGDADLRVRAPGRPPEPGTGELPFEAVGDADAVVVPALAVDTTGMRLGQGGGWYDRVLTLVRPGAPVVAMVFPEEVYDAREYPLPALPHDLPVTAVATTNGWWELPTTSAPLP